MIFVVPESSFIFIATLSDGLTEFSGIWYLGPCSPEYVIKFRYLPSVGVFCSSTSKVILLIIEVSAGALV